MTFDERRRRACFLGRVVVYLVVAWFAVAVLVGCATDYPPPPSCDLSANPELCRLERKLERIEFEARMRQMQNEIDDFQRDASESARRTCEFAHGAGSILCN